VSTVTGACQTPGADTQKGPDSIAPQRRWFNLLQR